MIYVFSAYLTKDYWAGEVASWLSSVAWGSSEKPPELLAGGGGGISTSGFADSTLVLSFSIDPLRIKNQAALASANARSEKPRTTKTILSLVIVDGCDGGGDPLVAGGT